MAANSQTSSAGRKLYYGLSYGKLSTKIKDVPDGYTEIVEADLKAKIQNVEQIDLRSKYVNKAKGDYPYQVFYDSLTGTISAQEKVENDNGVYLNLTVLDTDGDTSIIQSKFYSKYTENLLNRLINTPGNAEFTFTPYQMPTTAEIDGKNKSFYNQGVSLKSGDTKIEGKYKNDDAEYPKTEQVKVQGKATTSRDKRLDFLYEKFVAWFNSSSPVAKQEDSKQTVINQPMESNDLPF